MTKEFKKLCGQIRRSKKYKEWKEKIIKRDNLKIKTPNIHHKKPFNEILQENNIKTLPHALKCKELWNLDNGVTIKRGEHQILSLLERIKYFTPGFLYCLKEFLNKQDN